MRRINALLLLALLWLLQASPALAVQFGAGSGTSYPSALDTVNARTNEGGGACSSAVTDNVCAEMTNDVNSAVVAIQTELGAFPKGGYASVVARLNAAGYLATANTWSARQIFSAGATLGNTSNTTAGNIRWSGTDFEGYTGSAWTSLTAGGGGGVTSVTGTPPIASSGGTTPAISIADFVASGASHARGSVPDPGASAGTTKFLREDATWAAPSVGGVAWNSINNPTGNAALTMAAYTSVFTYNATTGVGANLLELKDTASNTGTGALLFLDTATGSAALPFKATAGGTANGVQVGTAGALVKIGTGSVQADNLLFGSDATGDLPLRGASVYNRLGKGTQYQSLQATATTAAYDAVHLNQSAAVTGILPTANGGTGIAYFTAAGPTLARVYTFPDAAATMARTDAGQTFTGTQVFSSTISGSVSGNAATATALAADPADCSANQFANAINASGTLSCSAVGNAATTATSANTASAIVARDASGNFSAGTITATLTGNASTATTASGVAANSVALGTDTTGNYVASATASQGLVLTGTEGGSLGLAVCTNGQILKNVSGTSWACAADSTGGSPSFDTVASGTNSTAAMVVTTGASLAATGSGTIVATSTTGNAATVTTNANLTGHVTSTGNAAILGSFTIAQLNTAVSDADVAILGANSFTGAQTVTAAAPQVILGVNTTTLGSVKMFGNTSGDATIRPAAIAGTATVVTLPATSGTLTYNTGTVTSIATTSPITGGTITTTGTIACATCTTNAAELTANALVIGGGSQATEALGSLGTTTTVLHGNAAGAPTFGAVSLTADVSGILGSANGGTGNGFTKFSGPATTEKTFTLPNASATVLTDNALVTAAQGGTANGFFQVSGPATTTKVFTFPDAAATVLTTNAAVTVAQGGSGAATLTGILKGNGTSAFTAATAGTDYVSPSSTETLTNKTLNAESTGNVITQPFTWWLPAAGCNNATAGTIWDLPTSTPAVAACVTGTNIQKGVLQYADTSGGFSAQITQFLPVDWTTGSTVDVDLIWTTTATTGNAKWTVQFICGDVAASMTDDAAFPASGNGFNTVTTAAAATASRLQTSTITGATLPTAGSGSCVTATRELLHVKVFRDGADAADTIAATANLVGVGIAYRRAM